MKNNYRIQKVSEKKAEQLSDDLVFCAYCNEPFKECDSVIPGIGVIIGETDVVKYRNTFWHRGCIADYKKSNSQSFIQRQKRKPLNFN